jgi:DNA polymerase elongation subunit (family B)
MFRGKSLDIYESFIPPLLRYFHIHNVSPSGWISAKVSKMTIPPQKTTTCHYEYISSKKHIVAQPEKETLVPYKICSFDIEASSSHGDFPIPVKTYKRLATNVVDIFNKHKVEKRDIGIKLMDKSILTAFGMSNFDDIDLVYPKTEPTKLEVQEKIKVLLTARLEAIKINKKVASILTLDKMYSKVKAFATNTAGDDQEGGDDDETETDDASEMEEDVDEDEPLPPTLPSSLAPIGNTNTIIDILIDKEVAREEKIQKLNDCLTALFPDLEGDKTTFIGSTFVKYGQTDPYLNHCLVVGSCSPVEGAIIQSVSTENELLVEWAKLIQTENPDIIIGYNIFGFDYEFLFRRSLENGCQEEFLKLSRTIGHVSANINKETDEITLDNTKIRLATGEYDLYYPKIIGRFQIDLLVYFRKEFNLSSYKLDNVSGQFIGDTISKIETLEHETILYCKNITGLNVNDYIHIELSEFTSDSFMDGKKFLVSEIRSVEIMERKKGSSECVAVKYKGIVVEKIDQPIDFTIKSVKWGLAKDDVSVQDIFRYTRGTAQDRAIVAKYCIQDCNIVHHLMRKIDVLVGFVEMARICSVPMSFLVLRGQGIKLTSFVAKKCREKETLMPDIEKPMFDDGYEGAIVLPPKCSMYIDNPVACLDYSSLYPSNMISQNISHDSKVWTKEYDLSGNLIRQSHPQGNIYDNLKGYHYVDVEFDTYKYSYKTPGAKTAQKIKSGKKICRWAQFPDGKRGILPSILEELLQNRKLTKKLAEKEKDDFMKNILDKRQLAYKLTANSLYGQCGSRCSTFYEKDIAASTTAVGRLMITYAKKMIEQVYYNTQCETSQGPVLTRAEYVYGDTDSVFFTFQLEDALTHEKIRGKKALEITIELAQEVAKLCTQFLISPMELSYEKTLMPFILLSKKRYVGMLYETDPNKGKLKFMGLSLKRRDACDYLKDVYGGILNILMRKDETVAPCKKAIEFLELSLVNLISGKVAMDKLEITKALRSDYKNPERIGHKVLADRMGDRDPGNKPKSGDRIKYVFIKHPNPKALVGDRIETPEYILSHKGVKVDYKYYITNQLMKPLQQLFGLALEDIWMFKGKDLAISKFKKEMKDLMKECNGDLEIFMKKKEKITSKYIKTLLFDKCLNEILNKENKTQTIDKMFGK